MAKVRSPNYPSISLSKAIELADKIFKRENTHKAAPEVMAKALGYSGLNGASLGTLSALKKYGLLEEVGKDLKISSDALTIVVDPKDSSDRIEAIKRTAFLPVLFSELQKHYGETLPSDENLRSFLLKKGFSPSMVDSPIRSYRETMELVNEVSSGYNELIKPKEADGNMLEAKRESLDTSGKQLAVTTPLPIQQGAKQDIFSLDEGQAIIQWPANMSEDSFEDFKSWLKLLEKKIGRAYNKKSGEE